MIKFAHTNIITDDWKKLADFYINVFDCIPLFPERDLKGNWLDKATNIENAHLIGIHLALPGYENNLPTLEIFQYDNNLDHLEAFTNRKGFGHIAFKVDNVHEILTKLIQNGGTQLGEVIETEVANAGHLTFVYAKDIDGNIIEIQNWKV
ncbi:MAG: VOC family protein [Bacteroidales bacterium]|jgi:catechol 2,3-dioxygenase-like lactoylglutathione lyase family enzyme|nr:VOC family protein [Bacteroidales bacterium]